MNGVNEDQEENIYDGNGNLNANILRSWNLVTMDWDSYYKVEKDYSVAVPFSLSSESFNKENFKVYPNPASSVINVFSNIPIEQMELYDILGKKVLSSINNKKLNVESLKNGIYVLKVFNNNRPSTKKIVIK